MGIFVHNG